MTFVLGRVARFSVGVLVAKSSRAKVVTEPLLLPHHCPTCSENFTPAPWYTDTWHASWPSGAPTPPSYNCSMHSRADKVGLSVALGAFV